MKKKKFPRSEPILRQLEQLETTKVRGGLGDAIPLPRPVPGKPIDPIVQPLYGVVVDIKE